MRAAASLALLLAFAPVQCTKKYDAQLAREETAGDGLWSLAEDFHAKGDDASYRATLRFLVTRYPASRRAPAARDALEQAGEKVPETPAPVRMEPPLRRARDAGTDAE